MSYSKVFRAVILALFLFVLFACSPAGSSSSNGGNAAQVTDAVGTQVSDGSASATAAVDVNALILEKLQNHHSIDRVYAAKHTREEWNATLDRMIGYGAKISEDDKKIIIDYLLSRQ